MLSVVRMFVLVGAALAAAPSAMAQIAPQRLALCAGCHGAEGNSTLKGIPSLAAQPKLFLENQLVLIREGVRDIASMKGMLDGVTDAEVTALAQYYADKSLAAVPTDRDAEVFARGGKLAEGMRCGICHLPTYLGREQIPRLAGQREDYLLHSSNSSKTIRLWVETLIWRLQSTVCLIRNYRTFHIIWRDSRLRPQHARPSRRTYILGI